MSSLLIDDVSSSTGDDGDGGDDDDHADEKAAVEIAELRRCLADLVSVLALPVMWAGSDPSRIAHVLLDSLVGMLNLDLGYVWLRASPANEPSVEVLRAEDRALTAPELRARIGARLGDESPESWPRKAWSPIRDVDLVFFPLALGLRGEHGVLVAGSTRADFPTQTELLILRVAANQAAMGLTEVYAHAELSRGVLYREQMMAILGHDLRSPLSAVTGLSGLLMLDSTMSARTKESLGRIQYAASRMAEMIETILDFTRIRFGSDRSNALPITRSEMHLGEMCRDIITEALAVNAACKVSLEIDGGDGGDNTNLRGAWDRARLAQVVSNLLTNALTHGDAEQGVRLILIAGADVVTLEVINRGPTIPTASIDTLFEPFVRGPDGQEARKRSGLGLGLYIAKQVVASHGGTLTARSQDDTTTFTMVLPR